jgi:hypothetical protein
LTWVNDANHCSGSNPADLPVQASTKFELFVNLNTATTLGLSVPPAMLARTSAALVAPRAVIGCLVTPTAKTERY